MHLRYSSDKTSDIRGGNNQRKAKMKRRDISSSHFLNWQSLLCSIICFLLIIPLITASESSHSSSRVTASQVTQTILTLHARSNHNNDTLDQISSSSSTTKVKKGMNRRKESHSTSSLNTSNVTVSATNASVVSSPETRQHMLQENQEHGRIKTFCPEDWSSQVSKRTTRDSYSSLLNNLLNREISFHENEGDFHVVQNDHQTMNNRINCSCFDFDEGVFIECLNSDLDSIRSSLMALKQSSSSIPIKSYSIYNLSKTSLLPNKLFNSTKIEKLRISETQLLSVEDDAFSGLEKSLKSLSVSNSHLVQVPTKGISRLTALESLDLDGNDITSIDSYSFYGLPLSSLNLQNNKITSLHEYSLGGIEVSLTELILTGNNLTLFPIASLKRLKNLKSLKLNSNFISSIPESLSTKLSSLESLDMRNNRISKLTSRSLMSFPSLVSLSLSNNIIDSIEEKTLFSLSLLESLDLSRNQIKSFESNTFSSLKKIKSIDLSSNSILAIDKSLFYNLLHLKELFLSHNKITHLLNGTFSSLKELRSLFLDDNCIQDIESGVFSPSLLQLHLSFNSISSLPLQVFHSNHELQSLSLDHNLMTEITPSLFESLKQLRDLRLQSNYISIVKRTSFNSILSLQELHLQNNVINSIQVDSFISLTNLEYLNLQGNEVKSMNQAVHAPKLKYLYFNHNSLTHFSLQQPSLENLYLNHNNLTVITQDMFNMTSLEKLLLNHNNIMSIEPFAFERLASLIHLNLKDNRIQSISSDIFQGLTSLEFLDLSCNPIKEIARFSFSPLSKSLRSLFLDKTDIKTIRRDYFSETDSLTSSFPFLVELRLLSKDEEDQDDQLTDTVASSPPRNCPVSLKSNASSNVIVVPEASSKALIFNVLLENVSIVGLSLICSSLLFVLVSIVSIAGVILRVKTNRRKRRVKQSQEESKDEDDDDKHGNNDMIIPDLHLHLSHSHHSHLYCHDSHLSPHLDIQLTQQDMSSLPDPPSILTQEDCLTYRHFPLAIHDSHSFYT